MARWFLGVLVMIVASSCAQSGDGGATIEETSESAPNSDQGSAFVEVEGPWIGLVVATSIDEQARAIDPTQRFGATAPQLTAAAFAGSGEGELVFEWFQVDAGDGGAGAGRVKLFEHRVAVGPLDRAFSVGGNPGTLAVGSYAVVASLGEASTEVSFEVEGADGGGARASSGQAAGAPLPGESGLGSPATEADPVQPHTSFQLFSRSDTVINPGPVLHTILSVSWLSALDNVGDRDVVVEATIAAGGTPARQRLERAAGAPGAPKMSTLDPCRLAGGSDLPGTRLTLGNRFLSGGPGTAETWPVGTAILGPDETVPVISTFDASPRPGSRVEPGDTIGVDVIARDQKREGATWQTGVKLLEVRANGEVVGEPVYGPRLPTPCDDAGRVLNLRTEYRVPRNPQPVIRLCAQAEDYKENIGERCHRYPTEDSWAGTFTGRALWDCSSYGRRPGKLEGSYTIEVAEDATATLAGSNTVTGSCSGPNVGTRTTPITMTGRRTETGFEFPGSLFQLPGSFTIRVTGESGSGALSGTTADGVQIELDFEIQLP